MWSKNADARSSEAWASNPQEPVQQDPLKKLREQTWAITPSKKQDPADEDELFQNLRRRNWTMSPLNGPGARDWGMVTRRLSVTSLFGNKKITLEKGDVVQVTGLDFPGPALLCAPLKYPKELISISANDFFRQPALANTETDVKDSEPSHYRYQAAAGRLWNQGPKPGDIRQGIVGDCGLIAVMLGLARSRPQDIKAIFREHDPNRPYYTLTLYPRRMDGKRVPREVTVDRYFPTDPVAQTLLYATESGSDGERVLWGQYIEKAVATVMGGYGAVSGILPSEAFTLLTGRPAVDMFLDEKVAVPYLRKLLEQGSAISLWSSKWVELRQYRKILPSGDGIYQGQVHLSDNRAVRPETFRILDRKRPDLVITVNRQGKLVDAQGRVKSGRLYEGSGRIENLTFAPGHAPESADDLYVEFSWSGVIDPKTGVNNLHAYYLDGFQGDKFIIKNPHGSNHPQPLTAKQLMELFQHITESRGPMFSGTTASQQ